MELGISNILLSFGTGLMSVLSPCVLPVIPVIMAGAEKNDRIRPLFIVAGLSLTFMAMGAVSSLFGALLVGRTRYLELAGASVIMIMGLMLLFDVSIFKRLYRLSNIRAGGAGRAGGFILGMALGVVWVPCIGPMLSSILAMVGTRGQITAGITLLGFYSLGLAIPMLLVAYSSHIIQSKIRIIASQGTALRYVSGSVLLCFGLYSILLGNFAF